MKTKLLYDAVIKYMAGLLLVSFLLFVPAGTTAYWNGWLFIGLLFIPMFFLGIVLFWKAPDLLSKRLQTKEKESDQKMVIAISGIGFLAGFILAAVDYRMGWTKVPVWLVGTASILLILSYGLYAEVMRENAYLSRTVEVQDGQKVIDTGVYGIVRHPMYAATIILFMMIPLVLGSWISFLIFMFYPAIIIKRILGEEKVLEQGLDGYKDYKKRVKYRLIPFIW